jgi:predicted nucleic acid-binding protein
MASAPRQAIIDTCIYIELFRHGRFRERLEQMPYLVRHCAVVLSELRRGAAGRKEARYISDLEEGSRVCSPGVREWKRTGEILAKLRERHGFDPRRIRDLHFDALIALTARAIGAVLITCNGDDFLLLREYDAFELEVW